MGAHLPKLFCFLSSFHTCLFESQNPLKRLFQVCTVTQPLLHNEDPKLTEYVSRVFLICQIATIFYDYVVADLVSDAK